MEKLLSGVLAVLLGVGSFLGWSGGRNAPPSADEPATALTQQAPAPTPTPTPTPTVAPEPVATPAPTAAPTPNATKAYKYLDALGPDCVISIEDVSCYDFSDHGFASVGGVDTGHGNIPFDAYYGLKLTCIPNAVELYWHNYTDLDVEPVAISVTSPVGDFAQELPVDAWGESAPYKVNTGNVPNGPYRFDVSWSNGKSVTAWFYKNGDETWSCHTSNKSADYIYRWTDRKKQLANILADSGFTPENSLDDSDERWAYPVAASYDQTKYRCDNQRWRNLADQLVPDKSVPDGHKLAVIHDWMTDNLAYDNYKSHVIDVSRAKYYNDYTGKYSMWDNHVGVCADFATVYCIMLRHVGVPTVSIDEDDKHVWNVAYVDGRWVEIDLTYDINRHVDGEDVSDVKTKNTSTYMTFGTPYTEEYLCPAYNRINYGMYTYKVVTGTGHY